MAVDLSEAGRGGWIRQTLWRWVAPVRAKLFRSELVGCRDTGGLSVCAFAIDDQEVEQAVAKLTTALETLRECDPRRFRTARRVLERIVVSPVYGNSYDHSLRTCFVDAGFLAKQSLQAIAATIVHEATHARFEQRGIEYLTEHRARLERACVREQIRYLEGAGEVELARAYSARLEEMQDAPWWTDEALKKAKQDRLSKHGIPRWLIR